MGIKYYYLYKLDYLRLEMAFNESITRVLLKYQSSGLVTHLRKNMSRQMQLKIV